MTKKNFMRALIVFFFFLVIFYFFFKDESKIEKPQVKKENLESSYSLNIIEDVSYSSKDVNGNEYIIVAKKGEIDASDSNVIFLTKVNYNIFCPIKQLHLRNYLYHQTFFSWLDYF